MSNGRELLFISVIGEDKKGIVANVSNLLYKVDINIEDITQKVIEGYFVMTMLVDMSASNQNLEDIRDQLKELGDKMQLKIRIQHENIFKMMHEI